MKEIDFHSMSGIVLGKGKQYGTYTFNEQTKEYVNAYLRKRAELLPHTDHKYLFTPSNNGTGNGLTEQNVNRTLRQIGERAGIKKRLHAHLFRHTCATHLIADGATIVQVRDKLRHKNIAVTSIYTHTNPKELSDITKGL